MINKTHNRISYAIIIDIQGEPYYVLKGQNTNNISGFTSDITKAKRFSSLQCAQVFAETYLSNNSPTVVPITISFNSSDSIEEVVIPNEPIASEIELRSDFIKYVRSLIEYWTPKDANENISIDFVKNQLEGLAHSILSLIDGETYNMPAYQLIPICSKDDNLFRLSEGEKQIPNDIDIAGALNDTLFSKQI